MNTPPSNSPDFQRIGFHVREEDLVIVVKVGASSIEAQLQPHAALELAAALLNAGIAHANARAEARLQAAAATERAMKGPGAIN